MSLTKRNYTGVDDRQAMSQLTHATATENMHLVDLPYRLSSWAFDHPENIALWHDAAGELEAWAVLQTPFWALDYVYRPEQPALHREILAWADGQAQQIVNSASGRPIWFANCFTDQTDRIVDLEAMDFADQAGVGENSWSKVFMERPFAAVTDLSLSDGFQIRPLIGNAEVDAYVNLHRAVFQSNSMTVEWRKRTLQQPTYRPDLDLVVESPNGELAAFCVGWFDESGFDKRSAGQVTCPGGTNKNENGTLISRMEQISADFYLF